MRRFGMSTLVPPGKARAIAISSSVLMSWKVVRFSSAIRALLLIGGNTAKFRILRIYGTMERKRQQAFRGRKRNSASPSGSGIGAELGVRKRLRHA